MNVEAFVGTEQEIAAHVRVGLDAGRARLRGRLLGGAGGRLKGGRVLDYKEKAERQMCRLYLSMMDKMNVRLPKFGDATAPLAEV